MIISWVPLWRDDHWYIMVEGARMFGWTWIEVWYQGPIAQWWTWTASLAELIFHDFCSFFNVEVVVVVVLHPRDCFDAIFSLGRNWSWIWTCDSDRRQCVLFRTKFQFYWRRTFGGTHLFFWGDTLQATNISHFGKRKIIFQEVFLRRKHRCFGREVSFSKSAGCQVQS